MRVCLLLFEFCILCAPTTFLAPLLMIRAYAKINLGLLVLERRPDGYHNIETVFHRVNLYDEIALSPAPEIIVESASEEIPRDGRNICFKAAELLQKELDVRDGVRITIHKNIPVGAGLGGGSSDAATVLRHLPSLWNRNADDLMLETLALQLGADTPYFLKNGSALATGRGEILNYFPLDVPFTILLCYPATHISTAWAYQQLTPRVIHTNLKDAVLEGMKTPSTLSTGVRNDFEEAIFARHPHIQQVKTDLLLGGAVYALMSGSGSAMFGLFPRPDDAERVAVHLRTMGYRTFLTPPHFVPDVT